MKNYSNPTWWSKDNDTAWDRVKAAAKRDWDQTKHDFGGKKPDTDQQATDTIKQAAGKEAIPPRGEPTFDKAEPALRFGYGARSYYKQKFPKWDDNLEKELQRDWSGLEGSNWESDRDAIHSGWDLQE